MIIGTSPETELPDLLMGLEAITPMYGGTVAGGPELSPTLLVQAPPQLCGETLAKPLKAFGSHRDRTV